MIDVNFFLFSVSRFQVLQNGTLLVHSVHMEDEGQYGCIAGNSGGFKREEVTLIVKSKTFNIALQSIVQYSKLGNNELTVTINSVV